MTGDGTNDHDAPPGGQPPAGWAPPAGSPYPPGPQPPRYPGQPGPYPYAQPGYPQPKRSNRARTIGIVVATVVVVVVVLGIIGAVTGNHKKKGNGNQAQPVKGNTGAPAGFTESSEMAKVGATSTGSSYVTVDGQQAIKATDVIPLNVPGGTKLQVFQTQYYVSAGGSTYIITLSGTSPDFQTIVSSFAVR